jgi:hypothetical protein
MCGEISQEHVWILRLVGLAIGCLAKFLTGVMVFNATFNNISAISWRSVLLVEETGVPGEYAYDWINICYK